MRVSPQSPVQDQNSYLYQWDSTARKYFHHFELHKQAARDGIHRLYKNFLTSWRDPIQYRDRYQEVDLLTYRQLLGDISTQEVYELNKVFSPYSTGICYQKSVKEPAGIFIWRGALLTGVWGACTLLAGYAKIVKRYNILWLAGAYAPLWTLIVYNWARQPQQQVENAYKYILAKRAATCEHEKNKQRFAANDFVKSQEYAQLQKYLEKNNLTLYQLEADLVSRAASGDLK